MPELQFLTAWWTILRERQQRDIADDRGDIVQYVVITAALALAAVAIVAIIVTKLTTKAKGLQTE
ncbi:hypothetical protein [Sporichthya polymorpha]|uniref:hypothetical protein n=1 Tax=Sporichthya polymorpha TaxID=35751 RepID=UPI0003678F79|nr:hypothetical protein [Sporichthya polymorpha]